MRRKLLAAVALAPLCLLFKAAGVEAETTISGGQSTAVNTSSTGDLTIESGGSISVSSTTPALTVDSSNTVLNEGSISITGVNGSTGVLLEGGNTGSFTNEGYITNSEDYTASTNSSNSLSEAPFASGSDRYGIRLTGSSAFVGDIVNTGEIYVKGNDSYGVSIEAPLTGSFSNGGTITVVGDNSTALYSSASGAISGSVLITDTISATGQNASAINLQGSVGGSVSIYSDVTATGYSSTSRSSTSSTLESIQGTASETEQSAAAVTIGGSVAGGVFIGQAPAGTATDSTTDADGDGIEDGYEGTGAITNFGSAPALLIGSSGKSIELGEYGTDQSTTADNAYGLIIRGFVSGIGTYDGVSATALQIGVGDGEVTIDGGVRIAGGVEAYAYEADATAIHLESGSSLDEIRNEAFIEAETLSSSVATSDTASSAYGILIDSGASVSSLTNIGYLQAAASGDTKSAYAVVDKSGTLSSVLNEGVISAEIVPTATGDATTGSTVALDLSANTTGVTLIQQVNPDPEALEVSTTTSSTGVVSTSAAYVTTTSTSATTTTTVTTTTAGVTTTTTTTTPTYPEIIGDVLLGNGDNTVELLGGSVVGALSMGSGTDSLTIDGDALYEGALTYSGSALALTVNDGTLLNESATTLKISDLTVGSSGVLYAAIDPAKSASTLYDVSGTATFASGSKLGVYMLSTLSEETSYTIVSASSLINNSSGSVELAYVPYLFVGTATTDASAGTISVDLRRRTASEMGLNAGQAAALNAVYDSLPNDSSIESAFLGQYTRSGFLGLYNQMLPDYSGGVFQLALAASDAVTRTTGQAVDIDNPSGTRGVWAQEIAFGVQRSSSDAAPYRGSGFGFVGGVELGGAGFGAFGLTGAFLTGDVTNPQLAGDTRNTFSQGEFGAYWQGQGGGFKADARLAAGYVLFSDRRQLYETSSSGTVELERAAKASSNGYTGTGHFGLSYQSSPIGWIYFRPQLSADYFRLFQGGYTEHGGGDGFDLAVNSRLGQQASASATLVTGASFRRGFVWRPELELGYRDVFAGSAGDTTARFAADSETFTLPAAAIRGGGPIARLNIKADTDFYELSASAGAEYRNAYSEEDVRFSVRLLF